MKFTPYFVLIALPLVSGCAILPPGKSSVVGAYSASIGLNMGASVTLRPDGTYRREISLAYCRPTVVQADHRAVEVYDGWTNTETGTWTVEDQIVMLEASGRDIQNSGSEKDFDSVRSFPVTYQFPEGWVLVYPLWRCVVMRKSPIPPPERIPPTEHPAPASAKQ